MHTEPGCLMQVRHLLLLVFGCASAQDMLAHLLSCSSSLQRTNLSPPQCHPYAEPNGVSDPWLATDSSCRTDWGYHPGVTMLAARKERKLVLLTFIVSSPSCGLWVHGLRQVPTGPGAVLTQVKVHAMPNASLDLSLLAAASYPLRGAMSCWHALHLLATAHRLAFSG